MANQNSPFGFISSNNLSGATPSFLQVQQPILYSDTTKIFRGDPVELSSGYVTQGTAGTDPIYGVFVGCSYFSVSQRMQTYSNYWPGADVATNAIVIADVIVDPAAEFIVQSSGTAITQADIGRNANFTIGTGNTLTGLSGASLNQASLAVTGTLPFKVVGLVTAPPGAPGRDAASSYNWVRVKANYFLLNTTDGE